MEEEMVLRDSWRVYSESSKGSLDVEDEGERRLKYFDYEEIWGGWWKETAPETELQRCKKQVWWKKAESGWESLSLEGLRWGESVMGGGDREQEGEGWWWARCQGCEKVVLSCFLRWMGKPGYIWFWWGYRNRRKKLMKNEGDSVVTQESKQFQQLLHSSGKKFSTSRYSNFWRRCWRVKIQVKTGEGRQKKKCC